MEHGSETVVETVATEAERIEDVTLLRRWRRLCNPPRFSGGMAIRTERAMLKEYARAALDMVLRGATMGTGGDGGA